MFETADDCELKPDPFEGITSMEIEPLQKIGPIPSKNCRIEKEYKTNITIIRAFPHRLAEFPNIPCAKSESSQAA